MEIKLTKDQQEKVAQVIKRIDSLERSSDSRFVTWLFDEVVNTKIVEFGIIAMSNKLTKTFVSNFFTTHSWLKTGKGVFKSANDNKALDALTDYVYNLLNVVAPDQFASTLVDVANLKFNKEPRNTRDLFSKGDYFIYGGVIYSVITDTPNTMELRSYNKDGSPHVDSFEVESDGARSGIRRGCFMAIMEKPKAKFVNMEAHRAEGGIAGSLADVPTNNIDRLDPFTRRLGANIPANVLIQANGGIVISYEGTNYMLFGTYNFADLLLFDFRQSLDNVPRGGIANRLVVSANFLSRNRGASITHLLRWYRARLGPEADMIDGTLANTELRFGIVQPVPQEARPVNIEIDEIDRLLDELEEDIEINEDRVEF